MRIAIFDSGVDTALYPNQLYVDSKPGAHSAHGLAFDTQGNSYNDLQPLTSDQKAIYPKVLALAQGDDDLLNGIDSPEANQVGVSSTVRTESRRVRTPRLIA